MKKFISSASAAILSAVTITASIPAVTHAENPIVQTSFKPDPAPVVFDDELYVFTGCDRDAVNDFYKMTGWQCFSTKDMKNWTDHGRILEDTSFSWCGANDAWASQCIERNGKYYFYFTTTNKTGGGRAIGVGVADSPEGPYEDVLKKPLCGPNWDYIDPTVMIDDDGQAWLMFGNPKCYYVKLKEDMVTLDGPIKQFDMNQTAFGPTSKKDRASAYGEGPWICKHDDLYYLVYAAFVGNDNGESMAYSTAPSVTGPWTYRGQIQKGSNCFTIHGGIVDYKDHSYYFYHMNGLPGGGVFNRSAACEEFTFNPDGTIPLLPSTKTGPDQIEALNPFERVEAETICYSQGVKTEKCSEGGVDVGSIKKGAYIKVSGVDFGEGADQFTASVSSAESGGNIEIHLDSKDGPVVGNCKVSGTGGWQNWEQVSCSVAGVHGEHDVYFVFNGNSSGYLLNFDWWQFDGPGASASQTDDTYIFKSTFEGKLDSWTSRGGATVTATSEEAFDGEGAVYCSDRKSSWQGIGRSLNYKFKAGESYSFSANVKYNEGAPETKFHFTLQYDGSDGETHYEKIDTQMVPKGEWVQLSNTSFKIPADAKKPLIYVETEGDSDDETPATNFYVDNIFAAVDGTVIEGAGVPVKTTEEPVIPGDINDDMCVDVYDVVLARKFAVEKSDDARAMKAADVNEDGEVGVADLVTISNFVLGKSSTLKAAE
ncbi:MAG: family 43 glycosylhydrolase [Ruminococcus sp.]|nr:family 43 glycosylhydrolase [Ruminococcus sp.]